MSQTEYWSQIARHWELLGPPLKPSGEDIEGYLRGVREYAAPSVAILGVTQEICRMAWPSGTDFVAVDHNPDMIHAVWTGPKNRAVCGVWSRLPFRPESRNIILCDGGLSVVEFPVGASGVIQSTFQSLAPGGLALFRLYAPPAIQEKPGAVLDDLMGGGIPSLNHLKLRLGMALEFSPGAGVELAVIWEALNRRAPDLDELAERLGWKPDELHAIDAYRDSRTRYFFPTEAAIRRLFESSGFEYEWTSVPSYILGDRCRIVCFRKP